MLAYRRTGLLGALVIQIFLQLELPLKLRGSLELLFLLVIQIYIELERHKNRCSYQSRIYI